jgi:hypothetical protein
MTAEQLSPKQTNGDQVKRLEFYLRFIIVIKPNSIRVIRMPERPREFYNKKKMTINTTQIPLIGRPFPLYQS